MASSPDQWKYGLSSKLETMKTGTYRNMANLKEIKFCTKHQSQDLISAPKRQIFQLELDFNARGMRMKL